MPNNNTNLFNKYTKTPFTQYFCNEDKGMKLRSGTVINCIKNTPLYQDLSDLYENMSLNAVHEGEYHEYNLSTWRCATCYCIINQLRFIERYHDNLRNETSLRGICQETRNTLRKWIDGIKRGNMKCECWHYHSWRVTEGACMLTEEYEYLSSLDRSEYQTALENKTNKPTHPSFYSSRYLHRIYRNNFLVPTDQFDVYGTPVKEHDYNLILEELKLWERYFRREPSFRIKAAFKALEKTILVSDCVNNILEFL